MNKDQTETGNAFNSKHKVKQNQQITDVSAKPRESTVVAKNHSPKTTIRQYIREIQSDKTETTVEHREKEEE